MNNALSESYLNTAMTIFQQSIYWVQCVCPMESSINDRFFGVCHFSDSGTRREKRVESEINKNVQTAFASWKLQNNDSWMLYRSFRDTGKRALDANAFLNTYIKLLNGSTELKTSIKPFYSIWGLKDIYPFFLFFHIN